jgi:hypothetical protein
VKTRKYARMEEERHLCFSFNEAASVKTRKLLIGISGKMGTGKLQ